MPTAALVTSGKTSMPDAFSAAVLHPGICAAHWSRAALTPASIFEGLSPVAQDVTAARMPYRPAVIAASLGQFTPCIRALLIRFVIRQPDVPQMAVADLRVCPPLLQRAPPAHLTYRRWRATGEWSTATSTLPPVAVRCCSGGCVRFVQLGAAHLLRRW